MGKGSSAPTSQGMPRFSGKGGIASPAPQNPYASQQAPQSQYASPLSGLSAIFGGYQQPSQQQQQQPSQPLGQFGPSGGLTMDRVQQRPQPQYQPPQESSYITTPYAAPFQSHYQSMIPMYTRPTRQTPAAFVPQSAKNYISPFGFENQREQTYKFDRPADKSQEGTAAPTSPIAQVLNTVDNSWGSWKQGGTVGPTAGRYLQGPGDGTSDSIPATIGNAQPARLADGEFVIDARTVSEIGNGSSNAGAKKLYAMMERVHRERKRAKRGQNSNADRFLPR